MSDKPWRGIYRRVPTSKIPSDPMEMEIFRRIAKLEKKVDDLLKRVSMLERDWYEERNIA